MKCTNCKSETPNKKFCSRSCANSFNNKIYVKRKRTTGFIKCKGCKSSIEKRLRRSYCETCSNERSISIEKILNLTVGDLKLRYKNPEKRKGLNLNASIRYYCGRINEDIKIKHGFCQVCGYDKHVELCHIKPISSFTKNDESTMREICSEENILILCRNHHWEFDNGLLLLNDVPKRKLVPPLGIEPRSCG